VKGFRKSMTDDEAKAEESASEEKNAEIPTDNGGK